MSLVAPGHGYTVGLNALPRVSNRVHISTTANPPLGFTPRQTNAEANYRKAMAVASADPRFNVKPYDRASVSRGAGQYSYAAAKGAQQYADGIAGAEMSRMQDAYSNAGQLLGEQARQQEFGMALAGLQEQQGQEAYMNNLRRRQRSMDFAGNVFGQILGGGALGGLV